MTKNELKDKIKTLVKQVYKPDFLQAQDKISLDAPKFPVLEKFPDLKPLPSDKLHVTMLHQQLAKPLKGVALPPLQTELTFNPSQIYIVERDGKKSVFAVVAEQEELKRYMEELAAQTGVQIEPNRT